MEEVKDKTKEKIIQYTILIFFISLIVILATVVPIRIYNSLVGDTSGCDYNSCAQDARYEGWNYTGSKCWDSNNTDCQDFLRLWNVCNNHRIRVGVC